MKEVLEGLGFTSNEAFVYEVLLKEGNISAGRLAAKCSIHRRSVYDILERLCAKGVAGYMKENNLKVYSVSNPKELLDIARKKEFEVQSLLPELEEIYSRTKTRRETVFFKGKNGVRHIFEDQINEKSEILIIGGSNKVYELLKYYIPHYERERVKYGIKTKLILDTKEMVDIPLSEIKYVDYNLGPTAINIYSNKVAIIVWSKNPYAILIDDENVTKSYRQYFEMMWKIGK